MSTAELFVRILATGAVLAVLATYPYVATAIAYRRRDNGLAYIMLVMSVGVWNGMFAAQLLSTDPLVNGFFYSLSMVGSGLAALSWFLFAATASSTPSIPKPRVIYGAAAVLVGLHIALAVTTPVHGFYWTVPAETLQPVTFASIVPALGYWLFTQLLVLLFAAGTLLFAVSWERNTDVRYTRAYCLAGAATVVALIGSNVLAPGGLSIAPLFAFGLATIGWLQAQRGRTTDILREYLPKAR